MLGLARDNGQRLGRRTARALDIPCGAGLCPCFVAGTLVATMAMSSVASADADVDSNAPIESLQVGQRVLTALSGFASEGGDFLERQVGNFVVKYDSTTRRTLVGDADPFGAAVDLAREISGL